MNELVEEAPVLVERCFRVMTVNGVYPDPDHFNILIKASGKIGDAQTAHFYQDDMMRVATRKRDFKNTEAFKYIVDAWITLKNWEIGQLAVRAAEKKGVQLSPEQLEKLEKLKQNYDLKAGFDFMTGKTQVKPQYMKDMEEASEEASERALKMSLDHIQPPLQKMISPEELLNRKARAHAEAASANQ